MRALKTIPDCRSLEVWQVGFLQKDDGTLWMIEDCKDGLVNMIRCTRRRHPLLGFTSEQFREKDILRAKPGKDNLTGQTYKFELVKCSIKSK